MRELAPSGHGRSRGLLSSRASGARIESRQLEAPAGLADVVACFWTGRWALDEGEPHITELLGDPCVHLVAELDERSGRRESRVVGVWTKRWTRRLEGRGRVRGVKLRAGAVRAFFDVPAVSLTDRISALDAHFLDARAFESCLLDEEDDERAFAAVTQWLLAHQPSKGPFAPKAPVAPRERRQAMEPSTGPFALTDETRLAMAAAVAVADSTRASVEALADECGVSVRVLQRLFREHVGATPKLLLRRARLQEAALRIERGDAPNLARLAAELGYTDQAHFNRDFRQAVGKTPRELDASIR